MIQTGNLVKCKEHGYTGIVNKVFDDWEDLKDKTSFFSFVLKDDWLEAQDIPFNDDQLEENWYSVSCLGGGSIWSCSSRLELIDVLVN